MLRVLAAATIVALVVAPSAALAAHGPAHGPSPTPLIVEALLTVAVVVALRARHALAELARAAARDVAEAVRGLAHHRRRRAA